MPRSILLGRPWPKPGEPLFLPDDTEYALAWQDDQAAKCPGGCGQYMDECLDPASEEQWTAAAVRCHACRSRSREVSRFEDGAGLLASVSRDSPADSLAGENREQ